MFLLVGVNFVCLAAHYGHFQARIVGNPFSEDSQSGAQVSKEHFEKVMRYIESAHEEGAELVCGGKRLGTKVTRPARDYLVHI